MSDNQELAGALVRLGAGLPDEWEWRVRTTAHKTAYRRLSISRRRIHLFHVLTVETLGQSERPAQCRRVGRFDTEDLKSYASTNHVPPFCEFCMLYAVRKLKWGQ